MEDKYLQTIAQELNIQHKQVMATALLLNENATVPFIARYRKEATGSLDEVAITAIRDRLEQLAELDKRREAILESLEKLEKLTPELKAKIMAAETMTVLEDIYLPYRPKRRTRATMAKEKGLEPLAKLLFEQGECDPALEAKGFVNPEKRSTRSRTPRQRETSSPSGSVRIRSANDIRALYQTRRYFNAASLPARRRKRPNTRITLTGVSRWQGALAPGAGDAARAPRKNC